MTHKLYEVHTQKFSVITAQEGSPTKQMRKGWNRKIRKVNLKDYNTWFAGMTTEMEEADRREPIFRVVKIFSGFMLTASSGSPSVDKNDNLVLYQNKLTEVWKQFHDRKFETTPAEKTHDSYPELGPQLIADPLTKQTFVHA